MNEKDCPVKLPLKVVYLNYEWHLEDAKGNIVVDNKDQADFICLACNSYFEQKKALDYLDKWEKSWRKEIEKVWAEGRGNLATAAITQHLDKLEKEIEAALAEGDKKCKDCQFWPAGGSQCAICNYEKGHPNFISKKMAGDKK